MKYIYIIIICIFFSCNTSKNEDKKLIEFNEELNHKNLEIIKFKRLNDSLIIELDNCKLNYEALDQATEHNQNYRQN